MTRAHLKTRRTGRLTRWLLLLALAACVSALWSAWQTYTRWLDAPLQLGQALPVELPAGGTLTGLAQDLARAGVLDRPRLLLLHARLEQADQRLQAGEYLLEPGVSPRGLLLLLQSGRVIEYPVTFVEGWSLAQIREALKRQEKLRHSVAQTEPDQLLAELGLAEESQHPEGLFFPDTYLYRKGMSDADIMRQSYRRMQTVLQREWQQRDPDLPYESPYEALIMASLVEKETGMAAERTQIAGVFTRRLQRGMRLQTDPAVIYGLGPDFDGDLTRAHLRQPGPYNTYLNHGLPPTPIAAAGLQALRAALHPEEGETLYFVARGDGSHEFSTTLEQHRAAVRRYQVERRATNYRSSPPTSEPAPES